MTPVSVGFLEKQMLRRSLLGEMHSERRQKRLEDSLNINLTAREGWEETEGEDGWKHPRWLCSLRKVPQGGQRGFKHMLVMR